MRRERQPGHAGAGATRRPGRSGVVGYAVGTAGQGWPVTAKACQRSARRSPRVHRVGHPAVSACMRASRGERHPATRPRRPAVRRGRHRLQLGTDDRLPTAGGRAPRRARGRASTPSARTGPPQLRRARPRRDRAHGRSPPGLRRGGQGGGRRADHRGGDLRGPRRRRRGGTGRPREPAGRAAADDRRRPRGAARVPRRRPRPAGAERLHDGHRRGQRGALALPRAPPRALLVAPARLAQA